MLPTLPLEKVKAAMTRELNSHAVKVGIGQPQTGWVNRVNIIYRNIKISGDRRMNLIEPPLLPAVFVRTYWNIHCVAAICTSGFQLGPAFPCLLGGGHPQRREEVQSFGGGRESG